MKLEVGSNRGILRRCVHSHAHVTDHGAAAERTCVDDAARAVSKQNVRPSSDAQVLARQLHDRVVARRHALESVDFAPPAIEKDRGQTRHPQLGRELWMGV